jgi:lysophospholipase L1-like esterase
VAHDLVHLTREGRERMATMLYDALITRYQGWEPER